MDHFSGLAVVAVLFLLIALAIFVRSGIGTAMVAAWGVTTVIVRALLYVPWGLLLAGIGIAIVWRCGGLLGWLIGAWLIYTGGNYLFGSLTGLVTVPPMSDTADGVTTATRATLRRAGLLNR